MTATRFIYEGYATDELYNELKADSAFPLVRELEFKYGLKVLRRVSTQNKDHRMIDAWLLVNKVGIAIGYAYTENNEGKIDYCFRTPYYKKERGQSSVDRSTLHSNKISSLMATITRHDVIKSINEVVTSKLRVIPPLMSQHRDSLGKSNKYVEMSANEVHALLLMALGKSPNSEWVKIDQNKCIETLDKWEEADRVARTKIEQGKRFFANPFFLVGVDDKNDFLVGKFRVVTYSEDNVVTETIEPFKRYKSYDEVPDLIPVMTMVKLAFESKDTMRKLKCGMPIWDGYDENLDAVFYYGSTPTDFDQVFMATPCATPA